METQMPTTKPVHFEFIDLLRAIAIIGVLLQHSATYMLDVEETFPALFYQKSSKWNILLFIFISGFLLIPKDIPISLMWKKYIKRIIIAFVFWSLLYSIYNAVVLILNGNESGGGHFKIFCRCFHFWWYSTAVVPGDVDWIIRHYPYHIVSFP